MEVKTNNECKVEIAQNGTITGLPRTTCIRPSCPRGGCARMPNTRRRWRHRLLDEVTNMSFWKIIACVGAIATLGFVLCQIVVQAHGTIFGFLPITFVLFELTCAGIIIGLSPKSKLPTDSQQPQAQNTTKTDEKTAILIEGLKNRKAS
jgi:hypothetical protein